MRRSKRSDRRRTYALALSCLYLTSCARAASVEAYLCYVDPETFHMEPATTYLCYRADVVVSEGEEVLSAVLAKFAQGRPSVLGGPYDAAWFRVYRDADGELIVFVAPTYSHVGGSTEEQLRLLSLIETIRHSSDEPVYLETIDGIVEYWGLEGLGHAQPIMPRRRAM